MYRIKGWFPNGNMGGAGFYIILTQKWKEAVTKSDIDQKAVDNLIQSIGNDILQAHGYKSVEQHLLSCSLRVIWGEWGPEHIIVPGNACSLDINNHDNEIVLTPHNIDTVSQASMLLTLFVYIAEVLESEESFRNSNTRQTKNKITCPNCGWEDKFSWAAGDSGNMVCDRCHTKFHFEKNLMVTFSTFKIDENY